MSKETRPAFMFYASDWLSSTADMDAAERGMYINLLCHQWLHGSLPDDFKKLCRLAGIERSDSDATSMLQALLKHRFKHDASNAYYNARLEQVRERKAATDQKFSERGAKGAAARWQKGQNNENEQDLGQLPLSEEMLQASSKHPLSNAKNILNEHEHRDENEDENRNEKRGVQGGIERTPKFDAPAAVKAFQFFYKLKQGKPRPLETAFTQVLTEAFNRLHIPYSETAQRINLAAKEFMDYHAGLGTEPQFIPNPETWLNDGSWQVDWKAAAETATSQKIQSSKTEDNGNRKLSQTEIAIRFNHDSGI